jgi:hypothetical protein
MQSTQPCTFPAITASWVAREPEREVSGSAKTPGTSTSRQSGRRTEPHHGLGLVAAGSVAAGGSGHPVAPAHGGSVCLGGQLPAASVQLSARGPASGGGGLLQPGLVEGGELVSPSDQLLGSVGAFPSGIASSSHGRCYVLAGLLSSYCVLNESALMAF